MWFDAQAALAKLGGERESDACPPATTATTATNTPGVAKVAIVAAPFATTAKLSERNQTVPLLSPMSQAADGDGYTLQPAYFPSSGHVWFFPEQLRVTTSSSDEVDGGKVSVGMFENAAAEDATISDEKAPITRERATLVLFGKRMEHPHVQKMNAVEYYDSDDLPKVNFRHAVPTTSCKMGNPCVASAAAPSASEITRYDETAGGRVKTWTGRVVSLDEWRRLTAWEWHGPDGRHWCGITSTWTNQKGD